jgi:hypothetical protein
LKVASYRFIGFFIRWSFFTSFTAYVHQIRGTSAKPSAPQPTPATKPEQEERKTDMARTSTKSAETPQSAETSASLIDQVEQIKETLKNVVRDLSGLVDAVKQAEKDKRATEKEVEIARTVLKKLQQVSI